MASGFDPYYKWLGIPSEEQPPDHYRLLGLRRFESDPEVIEAASDQRMAHLRTYQSGQYSALSQKLLNEVAGAKICLLSPEKRARYDETLRSAAPAVAPEVPTPAAIDFTFPPETSTPAVPEMPLPVAATTLPFPAVQGEPMAPPATRDHVFDLGRLGVSEDMSGASDIQPAGGIGWESQFPEGPEVAFPTVKSHREPTANPGHKSSVAVLAACVALLGLVTALAYYARVKRAEDTLVSEDHSSSADSAAFDSAKIANPSAVGEDLPASQKHPPDASTAKQPALVHPGNGATLPNPNPPIDIVLQWQPVANASRYWARVEVPNITTPVVDEQHLNHTSLRMKFRHPVPRKTCHGWRWQVRAMVDGKWTDWSAAHTFDFVEPADQAAATPVPEENPQVQPEPAEPESPAEPEKPAQPAKPIVRHPLPSEAARKLANQAFREVYAKQYAAAKTAEEHLALADNMLRKAEEWASDPAAQYVLMDRARVLSANAGDVGKALEIVEQIGRHFRIDVLAMRVETMTDGMQPGVPPMARDRDIGESVLEAMEQLGRAEQYDAAVRLGNLYRNRARRPVNAALMRRVVAQIKAMRDAQQESVKVGEARKLLESRPDDPAANAAVGRYFCLFQGDWEAGLPLLAKGTAGPLADLAQLEKAGSQTPAARLKLADAWYDQAEKESPGPLRSALYRRARHWYESCKGDLSDVERAKAEKRIGEMGE